MKKIIKASMLAAVLLLIPAHASAEDMYFDPYVGVGLGMFSLNTGSSSDWVTGGFAQLGAEINPYLSPQLRLGGAGQTGATSGYSRAALDWFASYLLRVQVPATDVFMVYGLVGGTTMRTSLTPTGGSKLSDTSTKFSFGGGIEYNASKHLDIGAEWVRYGRGYKSASNRGLNVNGAMGVVKYSF